MSITLILGDSNPQKAEMINQLTGAPPHFRAVAASRDEFLGKSDFDAVYLSLPAAEKWGSRPLPLHQAEVLRRSDHQEGDQLPLYIVTGTVVTPEELNNLKLSLQRILRAVVTAVRDFNGRQGVEVIRKVGLWQAWVGTDRMTPADIAEVVRSLGTTITRPGP